ncbi:MAG: DUF1178 family protein [Ramlibacter sp.]
MKVLDLQCVRGHGFEGWFASGEDFESQQARGLVECPVCGDRAVVKLLSAPRLNLGSGSDPQAAAVAPGHPHEARWLHAVRKIMRETEDVGDRFTEEARRIHYGESPDRGIRGCATPEQSEALRDEGITVMALPIPASLKETLQ